MARIERLTVENYRGASTRLQLDFESSKPIALVFGESGTGKTTIADALDAIGNCSKGSLEDKSSTRAREHLPTIGKKPADVRIEVTSGGSTWSASLAGDNLTTIPQVRPKIRVRRRNHLQRLIEAQPAQRYEALRHFIDVDKVERSENALRDSASGAKTDFEAAVKQRADAEDQLEKVWLAEGKPGRDAHEWAKAVAGQDTAMLDVEVQRLRSAQQVISTADAALGELHRACATTEQRDTEAQAVEQEVAKLPGIGTQQAMSLAGILKQVSQHLQVGQYPDECPVCRQAIPLDQLKADIQVRLAQLKQYDDLQIKRNTATRNVQVARQAVEPKRDALLGAARGLVDIVQKGEIDIVTASGINLTDYVELAKQDGADATVATADAEKLVGAFVTLKQSLADAEINTGKKSGQINSIRELNNRVQTSIERTEHLERLQSALQEAYDIARLTRIEFTQRILDDVASECNRLYAIIHPNERISISRLALDQGRRASLNQAATFEGYKDVPPQAYFSDSHLDTLGFCFWIATAKRESPKADAVIVLDDVFTSVDSQHINRIAQLITDECHHFAHVIITTHQRLWRDIYRNPHGAGKLTYLVELQRWSLAKGISNFKTRLSVDELVDAIKAAPFDRQVTASKAGVLLEATLDYLALQYRCRVPRTADNSYTLNELLDGTASLFKVLEMQRPVLDAAGQAQVPPQYTKPSPATIVVALRNSAFVRNQVGAHYNVSGTEISDADVAQFADLTVQLAAALSCQTCGQIPGKKAVTHFECSCAVPNEVRMLPLQL
jgi:energy-coupling factor transporter ATP-binding protein EcfA2